MESRLLLDNIEELVEITKMLVKEGKKERAITYLVAAIEEESKIDFIVLEQGFFVKNPISREIFTRVFSRKFRDHKYKQILCDPEKLMKLDIKASEKDMERHEIIQKHIEAGRVGSLYIEIKNGKFITPREAYDNNKFFKENFDRILEETEKIARLRREEFGYNEIQSLKKLKSYRLFFTTPTEEIFKAYDSVLKPKQKSATK